MNTVELSVRSRLLQIADELGQISDKSQETSEELNKFSANVSKQTEKQMKTTENFLGKLRGLAGRVAHEMAEDFKALFAVAGVSEGLKLGSTFRDNIKQTFELSDAIRKLSSVFGIGGDRFVSFQTRLTQGLGEIGLSSESALQALRGLSETQVRGEDQLLEYSRLAGQLASVGGQKGQEGQIAKGIAGVLTAQGKNPNELGSAKALADDLRRGFNATGMAPTEMLRSIEHIMAKMPTDFRKSLTTGGVASLGTTAAVAGPNATAFLEEYLSKGSMARQGLEARGFKDVFGPNGLNIEKFRKASNNIMKELPGDPRLMAQTLGLSEEAAEGFVRLAESLDRVDAANQKMARDQKTLTSQYQASMTASEAFGASINKLKASLAQPLAATTNFVTDMLQKGFQSSLDDLINLLPSGLRERVSGAKKTIEPMLPEALDKNAGSTAVVAGAGAMTALLAGGGLRSLLSLGRGKAQGVAERMAFESVTGAKVQDVYVVNAGEIGAASSAGGGLSAGGIAGVLGKLGAVAGAGAAGFGIGELINAATEGTEADQKMHAGAGWLGEKFSQIKESVMGPSYNINTPSVPIQSGNNAPQKNTKQSVDVRVQVDTKNRDLKVIATPTRGTSQ